MAKGKLIQNCRLVSIELAPGSKFLAWLNLAEGGGYVIALGLTHKTVVAAKEQALKAGYEIIDGEAGVYAQLRKG